MSEGVKEQPDEQVAQYSMHLFLNHLTHCGVDYSSIQYYKVELYKSIIF